MTPLEKAQQILDRLVEAAADTSPSVALPEVRYTQFGAAVVDCESVIVAIPAVDPHPSFLPNNQALMCNVSQLGTFNVLIIRGCAWTAHDDGTTNVPAMNLLSPILDTDGQLLWDFALSFGEFLSKEWSVGWAITDAGLAVTTLALSTGIE